MKSQGLVFLKSWSASLDVFVDTPQAVLVADETIDAFNSVQAVSTRNNMVVDQFMLFWLSNSNSWGWGISVDGDSVLIFGLISKWDVSFFWVGQVVVVIVSWHFVINRSIEGDTLLAFEVAADQSFNALVVVQAVVSFSDNTRFRSGWNWVVDSATVDTDEIGALESRHAFGVVHAGAASWD